MASSALASHFLPRGKVSLWPSHSINSTTSTFPAVAVPTPTTHGHRKPLLICLAAAASKNSGSTNANAIQSYGKKAAAAAASSKEQKEIEEVEEEVPWIQEKALDLVEFTGSVTRAIPGPRVGPTSLPWILAVPLAYAGLTFVIAFVRTVRKFTSPKAKRRRLVSKNAMLCKSLDDLFQQGRDEVKLEALKELENRTGFDLEEILRKYIRYALNEKPFNPNTVADLIQLRRCSMLNDSQGAEILNEISRRIVRDKGPVVMDKSGYTEKGFKRKLAVQTLFGKVFYLSELPEFCSRDSSLIVKEIFGVTDEDADKLRIHTVSEVGNMDALKKMVDGSDSEDSNEGLIDVS